MPAEKILFDITTTKLTPLYRAGYELANLQKTDSHETPQHASRSAALAR